MSWSKTGNIFNVDGRHDWAQSHAQCPVVDQSSGSKWQIYFSSRDSKNRSRIGRFLFDPNLGQACDDSAHEQVLDVGDIGCFDDAGVMPSCILDWNGKKYLYYIGWSERVSVPYQNSVGLAVSDDGGITFKRMFKGPLLPPLKYDACFTGTFFALPLHNKLAAYYLSCDKWIQSDNKYEPIYNLKLATSENGVDWDRQGHVAIDFKNIDEGGIASAAPIEIMDEFHMWFCYRGRTEYRTNLTQTYRIGYAFSDNGLEWQRQDTKAGLNISPGPSWDSEMLCYPYVVHTEKMLCLFYNGNGFGKTGIGLATKPIDSIVGGKR